MIDQILPALDRFKQSDSWRKDSGKFIPNPATWINNERWNDEISQSPTRQPTAEAYGDWLVDIANPQQTNAS